ncbi:dynein intermediate chain 2, ciliary-like [Penaeus vannamei]|uniref:dynein intermediate chain 2, ciliary-like n=1 Tax=Penaeus vannamei TaxID=6689 RepID=UPI00387F6FA1
MCKGNCVHETAEHANCPYCFCVTKDELRFLQRESVVVAGHGDGMVTVYDMRNASSPGRLCSSTTSGKHLLPVMQVCCLDTEPGQSLSFYSASQDGRVSQWFVRSSSLECSDILDFQQTKRPRKASSNEGSLEGTATCIAISPERDDILLLGVDTGSLFQVCTSKTKHSVTRYPAHLGPVTAVTWNNIHKKVFASCALDWNVKVWLQYHLSPIVTLDLGGPVVGLAWSPTSSTVIVAVTEEGRVYVYDLFLRKCQPLCIQNLVQRRRFSLASVAFSPYQPVILVGGTKGYLVAFKLSPNLRKPHKDAKGADENRKREIELCKMERIITISKG